MNRKYIKVIIYTSIFSIAYGGFFYHRYTSEHSVTATASVSENNVTASSSLITVNNSYIDKNEATNNIDADDVPDMPSFRRNKRADDKKAAKYDSSFASATVYSDTKGSTYNRQVNYSQQNRNDRPAARFTAATRLNSSRRFTPVNTKPDNSSTPQNLLTASSNTSNKSATKNIVEQNVVESDGSEFLPDGSSQQDLFKAQSKNPRVYTIKDYQTADISCAPGYNDASSPHAQLIRGLKGC